MELAALLLFFTVAAVALVAWWLRKRGDDQWGEAPPSWEAQRRFEEAALLRQLNDELGTAGRPAVGQLPEADRLRSEVARLEEENRDLRAMLPTDDYRRVSRR